ncbi:Transposable element Tcb1 transposase [Nymphon striatum]|nr:Transposable element Tcb1 transposase [Nymphon striatum]
MNDLLNNEGTDRMDWPACSPDMNPIENLWAEIARIINNLEHGPTSVNQLCQAVLYAWTGISVEILRTLVEGIPRRVQAVQAIRGGRTNYYGIPIVWTYCYGPFVLFTSLKRPYKM